MRVLCCLPACFSTSISTQMYVSLTVPLVTCLQELSQHSGVALHHISQLYGHGLMYHATLLISKGGVPIMRLLSSGAALADLLDGG
jgi:hypothetical protein